MPGKKQMRMWEMSNSLATEKTLFFYVKRGRKVSIEKCLLSNSSYHRSQRYIRAYAFVNLN